MKKIFLLLTLIAFTACGSSDKKESDNKEQPKTAHSREPKADVNEPEGSMQQSNSIPAADNEAASPSQIAATVFNALTSGNVEIVKKSIYFEDPKNLEVFSDYLDIAVSSNQYSESVKGYNANYKADKETIEGDIAHVELVGFDTLGNNVRFIVRLKNINGAWKVDGDHQIFHNTRAEQ